MSSTLSTTLTIIGVLCMLAGIAGFFINPPDPSKTAKLNNPITRVAVFVFGSILVTYSNPPIEAKLENFYDHIISYIHRQTQPIDTTTYYPKDTIPDGVSDIGYPGTRFICDINGDGREDFGALVGNDKWYLSFRLDIADRFLDSLITTDPNMDLKYLANAPYKIFMKDVDKNGYLDFCRYIPRDKKLEALLCDGIKFNTPWKPYDFDSH